MTIKTLKEFTELLNRSEGISIIPIIAVIVIMSVMGLVFSSIMGSWKISGAMTVNSTKAANLAETAAMFALQDAQYRFYGGSFNYGTKSSPYAVISSSTEEANYWFERPGLTDDVGPGDDGDSDSDSDGDGDSDSSGDSGSSGDDDDSDSDSDGDGDSDSSGAGGSTDDFTDDDSDDDADDVSNPTRYSIIATGKIKRGSATVAKRQIKIKADIIPTPLSELRPGVHTEGTIQGNGSSGYDMWMDGLDVSSDPASVAFNGTFPDSTYPPSSGSRTDIVYQPPGDTVPPLDGEIFKIMATDQGHYYSGNLAPGSNYPNGSYYYSGSIPNVTYVGGDLSLSGNRIVYGVYYVKGAVSMNGNCQLQGIIICEGDITANGGGNKSPNLYGGVVQFGSSNTLRGNGNPVEIQISDAYFSALRAVLPDITVISYQETVSAN